MSKLTLHSGPRLLRLAHSDDAPPHEEDITARAVEFLFDPLELAPELRLRDLFGLFEQCPALLPVYRRLYAEELSAEAALGPVPEAEKSDLLFLELKQAWHYDSHAREYSDVRRLDLSGVGEKPEDDEYCMPDKDGLVRYSLIGCPLRPMLNLPLRLKTEVGIYEADRYSTRSSQQVNTVRCSDLILGDLLQAVLWDMTWFGLPEAAQEFIEEMVESNEEPGNWEPLDIDELMERLSGDNKQQRCEVLFESIGPFTERQIARALEKIPDRFNGRQWLAKNLGKEVKLRPAFRRLSGRDLRQAFGEA